MRPHLGIIAYRKKKTGKREMVLLILWRSLSTWISNENLAVLIVRGALNLAVAKNSLLWVSSGL